MDAFLEAEKDPGLSTKVLDTVATLFNGKRDNDIAVEVSSITGVSTARHPSPKCQVVPCHHMNYFIHPESVGALHACMGVIKGQ